MQKPHNRKHARKMKKDYNQHRKAQNKPTTKTKRKRKQASKQKAPRANNNPDHTEARTYKQDEDIIIYADDTTILLTEEPNRQTIRRINIYSIIETQRQLQIQWGKSRFAPGGKIHHKRKTTSAF